MIKNSLDPSKVKRDTLIAEMLCAGADPEEIAVDPRVNLSAGRVRKILSQNHIARQIFEDAQRSFLQHLPAISKRFVALCNSSSDAISLKAISKYFDIMGVAPTHTTNNFFAPVMVDNSKTAISPNVLAMIQGGGNKAGNEDETDVLDAEFQVLD